MNFTTNNIDLTKTLWFIEGTINDSINSTKRSILLDTGSPLSIISKKVWQESGMPFVEDFFIDIYGLVDDVKFCVDGKAEFSVKIGDFEINHTFLVAPKLHSADVLVGVDFFNKTCAVINGSEKKLTLNGYSIPILSKYKFLDFDFLTIQKKQVLPSNSICIIELHATGASDVEKGYIKFNQKFITRFKLLPGQCYVQIDSVSKVTYAKVLNITSQDITLYPGMYFFKIFFH